VSGPIAVLGDVHLEPRREPRLFDALEATLRDVQAHDPSLLVVLGDVVQETTPETDRRLLSRFVARLERTGVPVRCVPGNHDLAGLSPAAYRDVVGHDLWDIGPSDDCVFLDSTAPHLDGGRGEVSEAQLARLRDLRGELTGAVAFVHHPLVRQTLDGNYWHESAPAGAYCANMDLVCDHLSAAGVSTVVNGHLHWWGYVRSDDVVHATVDAFNKELHPRGETGNYALIEPGDPVSVTKVAGDGTAEPLDERFDRSPD
jgi:3',5'-cyclic AMP phosphodiesterase CpdA